MLLGQNFDLRYPRAKQHCEAPATLLAVVETLVQEGFLQRWQAGKIEDAILRQITAQGGWQGNPSGGQGGGIFPPDVVLFAATGTMELQEGE